MSDQDKDRLIGQRVRAVAECPSETFRDLLVAGGFDLRKDARGRNLSGLSFVGEDLRGIDFTGCDITDCDFSGSLIEGARFDQAILYRMRRDPKKPSKLTDKDAKVTNLQRAEDWAAHCASWKKPEQDALDDLPIGCQFRDAAFAPLMAVLSHPASLAGGKPPSPTRFAMSRYLVTKREIAFLADGANIGLLTTDLATIGPAKMIWRADAEDYCRALRQRTGYGYRIMSATEWRSAVICGFIRNSDMPKELADAYKPFFGEWCVTGDYSDALMGRDGTLHAGAHYNATMETLPTCGLRLVRDFAL